MESPVVVDKPPEYGTARRNDRGFPFDEEEGSTSGAWSELAARHPDIAARLRARPQTWARKRRPSSQDQADDFGDDFGGFDRFPFDEIPPEFREHFPSHFGRRFTQEQGQPSEARSPPRAQPSQSPQPQHQTTSTQTEPPAQPERVASTLDPQASLPQYGLRNTVDLGQRSPVDPSVDADERTHRSVSAPPETSDQPAGNMSGQSPPRHDHHEQPGHVRHIPIFVEGRDEPVINKNTEHGAQHAPPPPPPPHHVDREQYFADDGPAGFHHPPNFGRAFGTPFNKGFRQGPQPFVQQKVYPQAAQYARGTSPARSQSPKPHHEEHFVKVPVHHEPQPQKAEQPPFRTQQPQQKAPQQHPPPPQPQQVPPPPQPQQEAPQPKPQPSPNDPITLILSIQTDVLNLMSEVENFTGSKKDKRYLFLDEMLTRNLIKLDNIETDGKENIRQARREAIKCIQKCIAVLEAKAEQGSAALREQEMKDGEQKNAENGEVEMTDTKEPAPAAAEPEQVATQEPEAKEPEAADTRPETTEQTEAKPEEQTPPTKEKTSPKKKVGKKREKSKDASKDSSKDEKVENKDKKSEEMQVDEKGDKGQMEIDGASASQ